MRVTNPRVVLHYRRRAENFLRSASDLEDLEREQYAQTIGLLSVHGCIALADALLVAAEGAQSTDADHAAAARRLRAWCSAKKIADGGLKHFEWLLRMKNHFSYNDRAVLDYECWNAKVKMEQFFAWAFQTFPDVAQIPESNNA